MKQQLMKTSDEVYFEDKCAKHTLFSGTYVIQNRKIEGNDVIGLVKSTGFMTAKGSLVRDILYPKAFVFQFMRDVWKFVFLLAGCAFFGFFCVIPGLMKAGLRGGNLARKLIDLITIVIPPSLPAAMGFGVVFSL